MIHETLSPTSHGLLDYVSVVAFALAPTLFGFGGVPASIAYGLAGVHLLLTLATHFPMGMFDGIPLRAHGVVELVVSVALIVLPWIAGFVQPGAQWFFPVMGVLVFLVWLLSDYGSPGPLPEEAGEPTDLPDDASIPGGRDPEAAVGPADHEAPEAHRQPREQGTLGDTESRDDDGSRSAGGQEGN